MRKFFWKAVGQKNFFSIFSQIEINGFFHSVLPIPLSSNNFHSQQRFSNKVIISENQCQTRKGNQSNNNTRQNCPNQFQRGMMIKTLRNRLFGVVKSEKNSKSKPQNQYQNNNQKKLNICIQVCNSFHNRSGRILKPHLPSNRGVCVSFLHVCNIVNHFFWKIENIFLLKKREKDWRLSQKKFSFSFRKKNTQTTNTILTSFNFVCRNCTAPYIKKNKKRKPHNIYKMPIKNCLVKSYSIFCICTVQQKETNSLINSSNQNMKSMKTSCQIKRTSVNSITKCKRCRSVFKILTIHKQSSKSNCKKQISSTQVFFVCIKCVFCSICSKIRCQQNQSISFWKACPVKWNNSKRRPRHSQLNSGHKCSMQKSPQKSKKKHCFRPNKQKHSQILSIFHFCCMKTKNTFTNNISPPQSCNISQTYQSKGQKTSCSSILMKKQNQRHSLPLHTQSCQCRPRTGIYQMIPVVNPCCCCCRHCLFLKRKSLFRISRVFETKKKVCHLFFSNLEKEKKEKRWIFSIF